MRWLFVPCALVFLSGCGPKTVQVRVPQPAATSSNEFEGLASYYAEPYHGRRTASGEIFDTYQHMTAAHRTLPFNTFVRVTNKANGRAVEVRINDRGPFIDGRVIDEEGALLALRVVAATAAARAATRSDLRRRAFP